MSPAVSPSPVRVEAVKGPRPPSGARKQSARPLLTSPRKLQTLSGYRAAERHAIHPGSNVWGSEDNASEDFQARHKGHLATATGLLSSLTSRAGQTSDEIAQRFDLSVIEVRRNRYWRDERYDPYAGRKASRAKKAFVFEVRARYSIWHTRMRNSDSRDVYDTEKAEQERFEKDWDFLVQMGIEKKLSAFAPGDSLSTETRAVRNLLSKNYMLLSSLFRYFASFEFELLYLTLNTWTRLLEDCSLVDPTSKLCKKSDFDTIFIAVDARAALAGADRRQKALSRIEFIMAFIDAAIAKFVHGGVEPTASEALDKLIARVCAKVPLKFLAPANVFRAKFAYTAEVNEVLKRHETSLRNLFTGLASVSKSDTSGQTTMMDLRAWLLSLQILGITGPDVAERDASLCYIWSRMVVIDTSTAKGVKREIMLPWEGWLEALCRLSVLKALPTEDEIRKMRSSNAGEYMANLALANSEAYERMLHERRTQWADEPKDLELHQSVRFLIEIIFYTIEVQIEDDTGELKLSKKKVSDWLKRARKW